MIKEFYESVVRTFTRELNQDNLFVESVPGKQHTIKGFRFNFSGMLASKQTEFQLYAPPGKDIDDVSYCIRFDGENHKRLDSVPQLYQIAMKKLHDPNYQEKIKNIENSKSFLNTSKNTIGTHTR